MMSTLYRSFGRKTRSLNDYVAADEHAKSVQKELSDIEATYSLPVYDEMLSSIDDYSEMIVQVSFLSCLFQEHILYLLKFGYSTMFVAGFPLAIVMSLLNNYVELRVDSWKLFHLYRRPFPRSCEDIGTW